MENSLLQSIDGAVALLTLNRPAARNALNDDLREQIRGALSQAVDNPKVRAIVITGAAPAFCAGGDVRAMRERLNAPSGQVAINGWRRQQRVFGLISELHRSSKVTIAAVNGPAVGLGFDLALACDFIVADAHAHFASSFVDRGLVSDGGGMYFLPRKIGLSKAKDLLLSGRRVDAHEAVGLGIVDHLVDGDVVEGARTFADRFAGGAPASLALMKTIVNRTFELSLDEVAALASQAQAMCYTTDDHRESVDRFLNRDSSGSRVKIPERGAKRQ